MPGIGDSVHFVTERGTHLPAVVTGMAMGEAENLDLFVMGPAYELNGHVCDLVPTVPRDDAFSVSTWHPVEAVSGAKGGSSAPPAPPRERLR